VIQFILNLFMIQGYVNLGIYNFLNFGKRLAIVPSNAWMVCQNGVW
jgi:hypothetical protein